jgi:hypothetical protein
VNLCVFLRVAKIWQWLSSANVVIAKLDKLCSVFELLENLFMIVQLIFVYKMERIQPVDNHLLVLLTDFVDMDF